MRGGRAARRCRADVTVRKLVSGRGTRDPRRVLARLTDPTDRGLGGAGRVLPEMRLVRERGLDVNIPLLAAAQVLVASIHVSIAPLGEEVGNDGVGDIGESLLQLLHVIVVHWWWRTRYHDLVSE